MMGSRCGIDYSHHEDFEEGEIPQWTEGKHRITLRPQNRLKELEVYVIAEERDGVPAIDIETDVPRELLSDDCVEAIVNAVSLSTMPLVEWKDS